jgi:hypothetical protein
MYRVNDGAWVSGRFSAHLAYASGVLYTLYFWVSSHDSDALPYYVYYINPAAARRMYVHIAHTYPC